MDTYRALLVDAFTDEPLAGNAAGVVPRATGLTDDQLQSIARELAVSETAFVTDSERADRRLRFFTPTQEVDLCGHATVATHACLYESGVIDAGTHSFETAAGVLEAEVEPDGTVWMTQAEPAVSPVDLEYDRLADALGIDRAALDGMADDLPLAVVSTGFPCLLVPVTFLEALGGAAPDATAVERLCDETGALGIYAFTFDTLDGASTLHGRLWAPSVGIVEDPVTGTASGAAGAYLREFDAFDSLPEELRFEQGAFVDRPGRVRVRPAGTIRVGGRATTALDGRIVVPDDSGNEILEV